MVTLYKAAGLVQLQADGPGQAGGGGGGDSLSLSLQVRGDLNCSDGYAWRLVQHLMRVASVWVRAVSSPYLLTVSCSGR